MRKARNLALVLSLACAPAYAATAEVIDVPKPQSSNFPASPPASTNTAKPISSSSSPTTGSPSGSSTNSTAAPPVPAGGSALPAPPAHAATVSSTPSEAAPGPYEVDRKKVRNWLLAAQQRGVGLGAYIPVWDDMENSVKSGAPEADVKTKLDAICRSIRNQVNDSSKMQAYRPKKLKPPDDEDVEIIRVKWVGKEKGSDALFRDKANKWYENSINMLPREQRQDATLRRRLWEQRDILFKEMQGRWETERQWAPKHYYNHNNDIRDGKENSP